MCFPSAGRLVRFYRRDGFIGSSRAWEQIARVIAGWPVILDLPMFELENAVSGMKVMIIMSYDKQCFSTTAQLRQKLIVKNLFELRVLVSSPLVEKINR